MTDREKALQCVRGMIEGICERAPSEIGGVVYLKARALSIVEAFECIGLVTEDEAAVFEDQIYDEAEKARALLKKIKRQERKDRLHEQTSETDSWEPACGQALDGGRGGAHGGDGNDGEAVE